jgi:uncharacterized protein (DUF849 family)
LIVRAQPDLVHAGIMIRDLPEDSIWSFGGIGEAQLVMNSIAVSVGGGVRVGLEDNIRFDRERTRLATNEGLIRRVHDLLRANGRSVMLPCEFRRRAGLLPGTETGYGCA